MADLLIKGVEMPEKCYMCPCYDMDHEWCNALDDSLTGFNAFEKKVYYCPLVAVEQVEQFQIDGGVCWKEAR